LNVKGLMNVQFAIGGIPGGGDIHTPTISCWKSIRARAHDPFVSKAQACRWRGWHRW